MERDHHDQEQDILSYLDECGDEALSKFRQRPMNMSNWDRAGSLMLGLTGLFLLSRRLLIYVALAFASGYLVYRGLTGYCYIYDKASFRTRPRTQDNASAEERDATDVTRKWMERSHDVVEEASWESFPASDPPAFG